MAAPIPSNLNFPTKTQVPDHSIMDILGKQAYLGNQFVFNTGLLVDSGTAEFSLFAIMNPASNTKSLFIHQRLYAMQDLSVSGYFNVYVNPTGIVYDNPSTPINSRPASSNTSNALIIQTPVVSGSKGTLMSTYPQGFGFDPIQVNNLLILDPGQSLLVTLTASGGTYASVEYTYNEQ